MLYSSVRTRNLVQPHEIYKWLHRLITSGCPQVESENVNSNNII